MPDAVFNPIGHTSVVDSIVEQIETLILSGVLRDGARLPSERLLAEQMDVSRPKVREALKKLEERELIVVHHGDVSGVDLALCAPSGGLYGLP